MDINYFLLMINKYNIILYNINSILEVFDETTFLTKQYTNDKEPFFDIFNSEINKSYFIEIQKHILQLKNLCEKYIEKLCKHEFILDSIDINPEKSKTISYCKLCGLNDPNF
jgi:tRNA A37 threonylcarbamoyladenosine dehydratase